MSTYCILYVGSLWLGKNVYNIWYHLFSFSLLSLSDKLRYLSKERNAYNRILFKSRGSLGSLSVAVLLLQQMKRMKSNFASLMAWLHQRVRNREGKTQIFLSGLNSLGRYFWAVKSPHKWQCMCWKEKM